VTRLRLVKLTALVAVAYLLALAGVVLGPPAKGRRS